MSFEIACCVYAVHIHTHTHTHIWFKMQHTLNHSEAACGAYIYLNYKEKNIERTNIRNKHEISLKI